MKRFGIASVNISEKRGIPKKPVERIILKEGFGVVGDAHAGPGDRQVSLLASEDIERMNNTERKIGFGDCAENITTRGIDLVSLPAGARLMIQDTILEITQIGKECHAGCAIMRRIGDCIMPRCGLFAKVIKGGVITNESIGTYDF